MIIEVEKTYVSDDEGNLTNTFANSYKVTFSDGVISHVPHSENNRHYQEIQQWIADGGTVIDNGGSE